MNMHTPVVRGIRTVKANASPAAVLAELTNAFGEFKQKNNEGLAEVRTQMADLANRFAGNQLGGNSDTVSNAEQQTVSAALRSYLKGGVAAFNEVMSANAMQVGSDPEGGYTVLPHFSTAITQTLFESSPMRQYARVVTISTDTFEELVDRDEPDAGWVGETEARTGTDAPNLGKLSIPVHEIYAMPKVTQKLLDDSAIDIGNWLVTKVSDKFSRSEETCFYNGNGVLKPRGFLTYPTTAQDDATRPWGTIEHVVTGTDGSFGATTNGADKLIDLQSSLKVGHLAGAVWKMNRKTLAVARKLKDGQGNFIWQRALEAGKPDTLLGHPVVLAEDMPDIATDSTPIAFGNFKAGYTIVDRAGVRILRDALTQKPYTLFYTWKRVGGDVADFEAIKLLKFSAA
ncbi:phage major capsid protein [Devosia sp. BSSL-BM10]|uniref:Phage major capsid protein n=1 Tax=Devosia litorisediminis TaxID=2829817 RepID=A0A942EC56_9HYPH|nr:phage major capsid protein [Devosia litorisediminis]